MIYDLIVIGGGAAGLVVGNLAKTKGFKFLILEMNKAARKIRVTGNGKCNLTNLDMRPEYYNDDFVKDVIYSYPPQKVISFFERMGVKTKTVENRVYPYNESALTVASFLIKGVQENLIEGYKVESIKKLEDIFVINDEYKAKNVFFATGTDATMGHDSVSLLKAFGHRLVPFKPSLVWLKTEVGYIKGLNGIRAKAALSLFDKDKKIAVERGEVLFKKEGVSGIAAFMLSAYVARKDGDYSLSIDFAEDMTATLLSKYPLEGVVKKEISHNIFKQARDRKISPEQAVKDFRLKIIGLGERKFAQVLSGGIDLGDMDPKTMCSKLVKGLYILGECMNIDGQCGGYNLHWAFASAMAAMESISK
ncbi:MAG: NAD(P)/FAD-dependent oxidoreductase [Bacillota bacterium]|jgi:predicted Rossmann fold flavoprotein|nr:NAD(P)/FAD-dependent oxidoreductase [Bacillota bacterium]HHU43893.1 hypothetical protein [Clostridiales bacterium]